MFKANEIILDPEKKTILIFDGNIKKPTHIYGTGRVLVDRLKKQFNIVNATRANSKMMNSIFMDLDITKHLKRSYDSETYIEENKKVIDMKYDEVIKKIGPIEYIIIGTDFGFFLPFTTYVPHNISAELNELYNEFFDYICDDKDVIEKIDKANDAVILDFNKKVSAYAFSTNIQNHSLNFVRRINETGNLKNKVLAMVIDPALYTPWFNKQNIPAEFLYFENDKRGTRNFKKFPIGQYQHLVYDKELKEQESSIFFDDEPEIVQDQNFFFVGSIFQTKGTRYTMWNKFFNDFNFDNSTLFVPLKTNGVNLKSLSDKVLNNNIKKIKSKFGDELINKIQKHPCYGGCINPQLLVNTISRYKYGMILRCVSSADSLNFRPILYTSLNILPFLDPQYDPTYLQIPKEIQEKIVVSNSNDIIERIEYYNKNIEEREYIIKQLRVLFMIDEFENNRETMVTKYIKEIIPEYKG